MAIDDYEDVPLTNTTLQAGDRLLLYTDGITERFNPQGECYEVKRLCEKFAEECDHDVRKRIKMIMEDVNRFADGLPADDDQAILVLTVE
jgi:sigma-B regulation protein RsbU (phosphoserine phosphatase)